MKEKHPYEKPFKFLLDEDQIDKPVEEAKTKSINWDFVYLCLGITNLEELRDELDMDDLKSCLDKIEEIEKVAKFCLSKAIVLQLKIKHGDLYE